MAIKGFPNLVWVYKGQKDPATHEVAKTRYAKDLLSGDTFTVRQIQTMQNAGVRYETRVPQEKRKKYARKVFNKKYTRHGPFYSLQDVLDGTKNLPPQAETFLQAYGSVNKTDSLKKGNHYVNISQLTPYEDMVISIKALTDPSASLNRFEQRMQRNLNQFNEIKYFYLYQKNGG